MQRKSKVSLQKPAIFSCLKHVTEKSGGLHI